ncbi:hypothetical protein CAL7716_054350 [Calothrix sp. PCC 7716]|nr:hypothetical protein CAL7716_054350 [Calothrix sp. PCC 7716]
MKALLVTNVLLVLFLFCPRVAASKLAEVENLQPLQSELGKRDLKLIDTLFAIACKNSSIVREARKATGIRAFEDVVSVELSPSRGLINYKGSDGSSSEQEQSFSISVTLDPIKLITAIDKISVLDTRYHETMRQKRLEVVQRYIAYLQAQQLSIIAAHKMQEFNNGANATAKKLLSNSEYITVTTEMLNTHSRERLALEELAATIGLSPEQTLVILKQH